MAIFSEGTAGLAPAYAPARAEEACDDPSGYWGQPNCFSSVPHQKTPLSKLSSGASLGRNAGICLR
ncbi:hypothetical protein TomMM35A_08960 [Sphingobium sp. TomMM35A]